MKFSSMMNFSSLFDENIFETPMQINERIKNERIKANLSEEEMADKLGVTRSTYQYWEKKTPSVDKIEAVAKALGKPVDYFFVKYDEKIIEENSMVHEDPVQYERKSGTGKKEYIDALLEEKDRAIQKAEEVARKMESHYEDARADKEKLFVALNNLQNTFDNTLKEISSNLKETALSLAQNRDLLALLKDQTYIVSTQLEHQREALDLGMPGEKKHPVPFVKKGRAAGGVQQDGGKKSKDH